MDESQLSSDDEKHSMQDARSKNHSKPKELGEKQANDSVEKVQDLTYKTKNATDTIPVSKFAPVVAAANQSNTQTQIHTVTVTNSTTKKTVTGSVQKSKAAAASPSSVSVVTNYPKATGFPNQSRSPRAPMPKASPGSASVRQAKVVPKGPGTSGTVTVPVTSQNQKNKINNAQNSNMNSKNINQPPSRSPKNPTPTSKKSQLSQAQSQPGPSPKTKAPIPQTSTAKNQAIKTDSTEKMTTGVVTAPAPVIAVNVKSAAAAQVTKTKDLNVTVPQKLPSPVVRIPSPPANSVTKGTGPGQVSTVTAKVAANAISLDIAETSSSIPNNQTLSSTNSSNFIVTSAPAAKSAMTPLSTSKHNQNLSQHQNQNQLPAATQPKSSKSSTMMTSEQEKAETARCVSLAQRRREIRHTKRAEDNYELSDKCSTEDDSPDRSLKKIPSWCKNWTENVMRQTQYDPDSIFGAKVPNPDLSRIFGHEVGNKKKRRGSSQNWENDRLTKREIEAYKRRVNQTRQWHGEIAGSGSGSK